MVVNVANKAVQRTPFRPALLMLGLRPRQACHRSVAADEGRWTRA